MKTNTPKPAWMAINPNQTPIDVYTIFHVGSGAMARHLGLDLTQTILLSLFFEYVFEPHYKRVLPEIFPAPSQDSPANRVMDTIAVVGGWVAYGRAK